MIADLRRAFEYHAEALAYSGSCWLGRDGGGRRAVGGASSAPSLPPGTRLGEFELVTEIGRGGMGVVYKARQPSLGRAVALKVLPNYARHSRTARARFLAESRAAARIHHTNVVAMYARGEDEGRYYYAMELIEGPSLDRVIRGGRDWFSAAAGGPVEDGTASGDGAAPRPRAPRAPEDYRRLAGLLAEVAEGLACAHGHGVVHRDVKPQNILVGAGGRLYLTDFGLALLAEEPHLTACGEVLGTPSYLSPEQVRGDAGEIDHRADIYALGVTLYEILSGSRPFRGRSREQIAREITRGDPPALRRIEPGVPVPLETICLRAMERSPQRRYPTAAALAEDLRRFALGRRIRARRPGPLRRAGRWVRGHQVRAAAILAVIVIGGLGTGWGLTAGAARHREARHALDEAYETLAYIDYRDAGEVAGEIDRAEGLGAPAGEIELIRGLADIGAERHEQAVQRLEEVVGSDPGDRRARYMLAWARWREGDREGSQAAFAAADEQAGALAADGWFFRGLAAHFDDPETAIESYRRAMELRARGQRFYPQAALHLARAQNQRLYRTRNLEAFLEAESSLRQLAAQNVYGAYPYYLLSIAHRLAAEVYAGREGPRGRALAESHYRQALDWARRGEGLEPAYDRPLTAEAECLESMGLEAAALAARTRAIEAATTGRAAWEGYHYRWRLHYWLGQNEAALGDLARCAAFDPEDRFYAHVYPALVLHAMGRDAEAAAHARAVAAGDDSAMSVIWAATCLRLIGRPAEARRLLAAREDGVDYAAGGSGQEEPWRRALYARCLGRGDSGALEELAEAVPEPWTRWGEGQFHVAAERLAAGDRAAAAAGFHRAWRCFDEERGYTYHGKLLWRRLATDDTEAPGLEERNKE